MAAQKNQLISESAQLAVLQEKLPSLTTGVESCLAVAFPKSSSKNYPTAVHFAKQGIAYEEGSVQGLLYHFAVFGKDKAQAVSALSVTNLLLKLKGTSFYAGGKLIAAPYRIQSVLTCYLESCGSTDYRAHCHKVINDPFQVRQQAEERFSESIFDFLRSPSQAPAVQCLFPCRYLAGFSSIGLSGLHPSSHEDQIQAAAVRNGCDWCPNFNQKNFKQL